MMTSCYSIYNGDNGVSIAGRYPAYFGGRQFKTLAPLYWFFINYKLTQNKELYTERYNNLILKPLDAAKIYSVLGEDSVLLCWEHPGLFCHRRLVAKWFESELGILIPEFEPIKQQSLFA